MPRSRGPWRMSSGSWRASISALPMSLRWVAVVAARRAGGMGPAMEICLGLCPFWFSRQVTGKIAMLLLALHTPGDVCH